MLIFFRGLPGSSKTFLARRYFGGLFHLETDMFFFKDGMYVFDRDQLDMNHALCEIMFSNALKLTQCDIVVSNTFVRSWEIKPYLDMAAEYNQPYQIFTVKSNAVVVRDVPEKVIVAMRERWEPIDGEIILESSIGIVDKKEIIASVKKINVKISEWAAKAGFNIFSRSTPIQQLSSKFTRLDDLDMDSDVEVTK